MTDQPKVSALKAITQVAEDLGVTLADPYARGSGATNDGPLGYRIQGCIAGSAAMKAAYQQIYKLGLDPELDWFYQFSDVDIFVYNPNKDAANLSRIETILLMRGYTPLNQREEIRNRRVDVAGQPRWVTNSVRLMSPYGFEVNLINKLSNGNAMHDPIDVLKTFDWAWLTIAAWDLRTGGLISLQAALEDYFDTFDQEFTLLMSRLSDFEDGIMSQYIMLRQMPRLAKFMKGFEEAHQDLSDLIAGDPENVTAAQRGLFRALSRLKDLGNVAAEIVIKAYNAYADFMWSRGDKVSRAHGDVSAAYALAASEGRWQMILDAAKKYGTKDQLDRLLDELT